MSSPLSLSQLARQCSLLFHSTNWQACASETNQLLPLLFVSIIISARRLSFRQPLALSNAAPQPESETRKWGCTCAPSPACWPRETALGRAWPSGQSSHKRGTSNARTKAHNGSHQSSCSKLATGSAAQATGHNPQGPSTRGAGAKMGRGAELLPVTLLPFFLSPSPT